MCAIARHVLNLSSVMTKFIVVTGASKRSRRADAAAAGGGQTHYSKNNNDDTEARSVLDLADTGPTPEQALAETERRTAVARAISHPGKACESWFFFAKLQRLTSAETARRLGLTVSAVKARTHSMRDAVCGRT